MTALRLSRRKLVDQVMSRDRPIVVIEAPAGAGKSWLLEDVAAITGRPLIRDAEPCDGALWDVPLGLAEARLPATTDRLILAKRPGDRIAGLARAEVYGRVARIGAAHLLFAGDEVGPARFAVSGGWACLLPFAGKSARPGALEEFLRDDLLSDLSAAELVALDILLRDPGAAVQLELRARLPFFEADSGGANPSGLPGPLAACGPALGRAVAARLDELRADRRLGRSVGTAEAALGRLPEAIATFQGLGAWQAALRTLHEARAEFFVQTYGPRAFDAMLARFPTDLMAEEDILVFCRSIQAIKRGDAALSIRILTDRFGPAVADTGHVLARKSRYSLPLRYLRLLLCTWEDSDLTAELVEDGFGLLAELPADDDLRRGAFYNAIVELFIRDRRFAEADHSAARAAWHYDRANVPVLSFYIDLHRSMIQLFLGDPTAAGRYVASAGAHLERVPFDSPGDARLLQMLKACLDYELGRTAPLARFLSQDLDDFARGEIWPTLVEMLLIYGSQALGEHVSTLAAQTFLDRWRTAQHHANQFRRLIDIREVLVLQNANRWQESARKAAALPGRVTLDWIGAPGARLGDLADRDEVALALCWLRHLARMEPTRPGLDVQIDVMLRNPHLTARQRIGAEIWLSYVLRRQCRAEESMALLSGSLGAAAGQGALAILGEERAFLADLTATRRVRDALERTPQVRRLLRQLDDTGPGRMTRSHRHGLTRQELRILHGLAEGSTNKGIAKTMGLSEATVKFHLGNLYRKLGCGSRRDAVRAATALRLIA